jgi:predicted nucleic acid-binding protein
MRDRWAWDTTVVSRAHDGGRHTQLLTSRLAHGSTVSLPAPTVQELARGIQLRIARDLRFVARMRRLKELLGHPSVEVVPFDRRSAVLAGRLLAIAPCPPTGRNRRHGTRSRQRAAWALDIQIATCAFANGYGILTENVHDFGVLRDAISALLPDVPPLEVADARELGAPPA